MSDIVERLRYAATSRPGGICEEAADEIERLRETVKNLRESAKLRVHYHAAELADVTAERDEAREEVARLKDARVQFSGADAAEIKRLRDQLHLAEVARAAQVEGAVFSAAGWRERANQLEAQVAALTAERDTCGAGAGCLHKDATIDSLREKLDLAESKRASDIAGLVQGANTLLREQEAALKEQVAALEVEVREISGGAGVYMGLLVDCIAVLHTIDPDNSDEAEKLRDLLDAIDRALEPSRHKGALL